MKTNDIEQFFNRKASLGGVQQPLSPQEAIAIFDWLAGMQDIAYRYATDGCYARTHIMCRRLMEKGFDPQKAWAFEEEGEYYRVMLQDGTKQRFSFHVAPALSLRMDDGAVKDMIFDPAFFNGPATEEEWGGIVTNGWPPVIDIKPFGVAPIGYHGDYIPKHIITENLDQHARKVMEEHFLLPPTPARIFSGSLRNEYAQKTAAAAPDMKINRLLS